MGLQKNQSPCAIARRVKPTTCLVQDRPLKCWISPSFDSKRRRFFSCLWMPCQYHVGFFLSFMYHPEQGPEVKNVGISIWHKQRPFPSLLLDDVQTHAVIEAVLFCLCALCTHPCRAVLSTVGPPQLELEMRCHVVFSSAGGPRLGHGEV